MHDLKTSHGAWRCRAARSTRSDHITISENDGLGAGVGYCTAGSEARCHASVCEELLGCSARSRSARNCMTPKSGFWMGPEQWMIVAPHATHELLAYQLAALLGDAASVTEQSGAWVTFDVTGRRCLICANDLQRAHSQNGCRRCTAHCYSPVGLFCDAPRSGRSHSHSWPACFCGHFASCADDGCQIHRLDLRGNSSVAHAEHVDLLSIFLGVHFKDIFVVFDQSERGGIPDSSRDFRQCMRPIEQ